MTRKNILARLKKGEDPLELSIEKWQDIVDGKGEREQPCALCRIFVCSECPVVIEGKGKDICEGTPFTDYMHAKTKLYRHKHAIKELEFLKSLRTEK